MEEEKNHHLIKIVKHLSFLFQAKSLQINMSSSSDYVMETPLHQAVESGNIQAVQKLISKGAKIDARNKNDVTPLHYAAEGNYVEIAAILL